MMNRFVWAVFGLIMIQSSAQAQSHFRLATPEDHQSYLKYWPDSEDSVFNDLKKSNLIFYTEKEMPKAYQIWSGLLQGIHSPSYNISTAKYDPPPRTEYYGNPNVEFPWGAPAGLHKATNFSSVKFLSIPKGSTIRWWREKLKHDDNPQGSYVWKYPEDSVFGEILIVIDPEGFGWTFEVRTRKRNSTGWTMRVYRPYLSPEDLMEKIKSLVIENNKHQPVNYESFKVIKGSLSILKNRHPVNLINNSALMVKLPSIEVNLVKKLLDRPQFKMVNQPWCVDEKGNTAHAPTTDSKFHIIPKYSEIGLIPVSKNSCMKCHETVLKHVEDLEPFSVSKRDWYGRVMGSDDIFSFHIFEPSCISYSGTPRTPMIRNSLVKAGLLKHWNEK